MSQVDVVEEKIDQRKTSLRILALGFGLTFIHLFWYGSPWTAWLGLVCYAPFLYWLREYSKRPFVAGLTFGYFYALMNTYWLGQFVGRWTSSILISIFVIFIVGSVWGSFYGLACWLRTKISLFQMNLVFGLVLYLIEMVRMNLPQLEFPFCPIGEPLIAYPILAKALISAQFACAFTLIFNSWIALLAMANHKKLWSEIKPALPKIAGYFAFLFVTVFALGSLFGDRKVKPLGVRVALGQLGTDLAYGDERTEPFRIQQAADDLTQQAIREKADLLILPEGIASFRTTPYTPFSLLPNMPVLFGAQRGTGPRYQSAFLWNGHAFSYTDKNRLVVFGEYVPFRGIIPYPAGFQLPTGDMIAGSTRRLLEVKPGVTVGALICFESLFPSAAHDYDAMGANFLAIMSLDDWYVGTNAIPRLQIAARWRAVETKRWIVRVGSLGKTMVIAPDGSVVSELPVGGRRLLVVNL